MAKRRREKRTYKYDCTLTGETFVLTEKAANPDELFSVEAWYEMNPEKDDRPENIKKKVSFAKSSLEESLSEAEETSE